MNKTITYGTTIATAILLAVGCARRGGELLPETRTVQIVSDVSYSKISKGIALQATPLNSVRFLQVDANTAPQTMGGAQTFLGNRTADGSIIWPTTAPLYDQQNKNAFFVAYHPQGTEGLGTKVDWSIDGKTDLLLSSIWNAGTYSAPITGSGSGVTPLTFDHILAQLTIVFKADPTVDLANLRRQYGKITAIKLIETLPTATYTYATNKVTFSGTKVDRPLLQADCQTAFASIDIPVDGNAAVNAGGMFAPSTGSFVLVISTTNYPTLPVTVQLTGTGGNKNFEAGLKHTVTMTLKANKAEVVVSGCSIVDWTAQYNAGTDVGI